MANEQRELEYLRQIHSKYKRYFKKYFGFSEKEMANYMGITVSRISFIISGKAKMNDNLEQKLHEAFEHFDIINKIKDFKETESQKWWRGRYTKYSLTK